MIVANRIPLIIRSIALVAALHLTHGSLAAADCDCCEQCPSCSAGPKDGKLVCHTVPTYRWVEINAWDVQCEPVCLAGCYGMTCADSHCGADGCDGLSCDGPSCDEHGKAGCFGLGCLFKRKHGDKSRMRKKLMLLTQQVQMPAVEHVFQVQSSCHCDSCCCSNCIAIESGSAVTADDRNVDPSWTLAPVVSAGGGGPSSGPYDPTRSSVPTVAPIVSSRDDGPPAVAGTMTEVKAAQEGKTPFEWAESRMPTNMEWPKDGDGPRTARHPKPIWWLK